MSQALTVCLITTDNQYSRSRSLPITARNFITKWNPNATVICEKYVDDDGIVDNLSRLTKHYNDEEIWLVFDTFDFEGFTQLCQRIHDELLLNYKVVRVFGLPCFVRCIVEKRKFPESSADQPVYDDFLRDAVLCYTKLPRELKEEIDRKVSWMGGKVHRALTNFVTHMVADQIGSDKYKVAVAVAKPIVRSSWVDGCWQNVVESSHIDALEQSMRDATRELPYHDTLEIIQRKHLLPPFTGLVICVTGLEVDKRDEVAFLTKKFGGTFNKDLVRGCTHLVCTDVSSQKYQYAIRWGLPVVTLQWFHDCIERKCCQDESLYEVTPPTGRTSAFGTSELRSGPSLERVSSSHSSVLNSGSSYCNQPLRHAAEGITRGRSSVHTSRHRVDDVIEWDDTVAGSKQKKPNYVVTMEPHLREQIMDISNDKQAFDILQERNKKRTGAPPLQGCCVVLCGLSATDARYNKLRSMLSGSGASRFSEIKPDCVTHVVLAGDFSDANNRGDAGLDVEQVLKLYGNGNLPHKPYVVSVQWLVDSCIQLRRCDADVYQIACSIDKTTSTIYVSSAIAPAAAVSGSDHPTSRMDLDAAQNTKNAVLPVSEPGSSSCFMARTFVVLGFHKEISREIEDEIRRLGGRVYNGRDSPGLVTHIILPSVCPATLLDSLPYKAVGGLVTDCWFEQCVNDGVMHDPESHRAYRPLACLVDLPLHSFKNVICYVSQYKKLEKRRLERIIESLGGQVVEGLRTTCTHLVCKKPQGEKYETALKNSIWTMSAAWLEECVASGTRLPELDYVLANINKSVPQPNQKQQIIEENLVDMVQDEPPVPRTTNADENTYAPQQFETSSALEMLEDIEDPGDHQVDLLNPRQAPSSPRTSTPAKEKICHTPEELRRQLQINLQNAKTHMEMTQQLQDTAARHPSSSTTSSTPAPPTTQTRHGSRRTSARAAAKTRTVAKETGDDHGWDDAASTFSVKKNIRKRPVRMEEDDGLISARSRLLTSVVLYVAKDLQKNGPGKEIYEMAERMGASCLWEYDDGVVTHVVYNPRDDQATPRRRNNNRYVPKEVKDAIASRKTVVSSDWIRQCFVQKKRLPESNFPYTKTARLDDEGADADDVNETASTDHATRDTATPHISNGPNDADVAQALSLLASAIANSPQSEKSRGVSVSNKRRQRKGSAVRANTPDPESASAGADDSDAHYGNNSLDTPFDSVVHNNRSSQHDTVVMYEDSKSLRRREDIMKKLRGNKETPVENMDMSYDALEMYLHSDHEASMPKSQKRVFLFSSISAGADRNDIAAVIERLGGSTLDGQTYVDCTHVIAKVPSGSEKYLAALAGGKWILQPSYIRDCDKANCFVEEIDHVWKPEVFEKDTDDRDRRKSGNKVKLALAAEKWRKHVQGQRERGDPEGAFVGWKVLLHIGAKADCFTRVLKAGGAVVISSQAPFTQSQLDEANYVFIETNSKENDWHAIVDSVARIPRIRCLSANYISDYLYEHPLPALRNYAVPVDLTTPLVSRTRRITDAAEGSMLGDSFKHAPLKRQGEPQPDTARAPRKSRF